MVKRVTFGVQYTAIPGTADEALRSRAARLAIEEGVRRHGGKLLRETLKVEEPTPQPRHEDPRERTVFVTVDAEMEDAVADRLMRTDDGMALGTVSEWKLPHGA